MKIEEHNKLVKELLDNLSDQSKVSDILLKLTEDNKTLEENYSTTTKELGEVKEYNTKLKDANNRVLTQLTTQVEAKKEEPKKEPEEPKDELIDLDKLIADSGLL